MTTVSTVLDSTVSDNTEDLGALAPRVGPLEGLRQTFSLSWRTLVQIKHNPAELIDFSIQPVMFLLLFTYVFGGAIGGSPHAYLMFALPGIIVQNSLFTTLNTATGLSTDLEKGFFDRLRSLPIARFAPLSGRILADLAKQAWAVVMLLVIGTILGFRVGMLPAQVERGMRAKDPGYRAHPRMRVTGRVVEDLRVDRALGRPEQAAQRADQRHDRVDRVGYLSGEFGRPAEPVKAGFVQWRFGGEQPAHRVSHS